VQRIVEHKDATPDERAVAEIGTSIYAFDHALLRAAVAKLSTDNAQGEEYLTDVIGILAADGHPIGAMAATADETAGVNDRVQLATAHRAFNQRLLEAHMRAGVTVVDPLTTWVDADVIIEPDVTLWPSVQLRGATSVGAGTSIGPDVTLCDTTVGPDVRMSRTVATGAVIGAGATVGPFAYLRPGTVLAEGVHIGTYVEVKNSDVGEGSKIPHLSYVGDATIGEHTNVGAATVFVNYDGVAKHRTVIGSHARTGADNMFVAPVEVGDGAYTAAGSVIADDVPPGALGIARATQRNVAGWVARNRPGTPAADAAERALAETKDQPSKDGD
jgi:bifunctional UDP-N-acetylglucosamine pyrophosphorylase/glucosamine-1-phosphate N-acetyltransferase